MDEAPVSFVEAGERGAVPAARRADELAVLGRLARWKPRHCPPLVDHRNVIGTLRGQFHWSEDVCHSGALTRMCTMIELLRSIDYGGF